jgi:D-glycero-D-manno-heptose 1,7-bisphosphate phosphatase
VRARAVILDRDGVLDDPVPDPRSGGLPESPYDPADVRLAAGALAGVRALRAQGFLLVVASNQPAAAKGTVSLESLWAVHERVEALLREGGMVLDGWYYCHHHPAGVVPELSGLCDCRKPAPGLLLRAAEEHDLDLAASWMVGDSDADVEAGRRAGCRTVLIEHPGSAHRRSASVDPTLVAADLAAAAVAIERRRIR